MRTSILPQVVSQIGAAVGQLGETIGGKLFEAEAKSQYLQGQELLRRSMMRYALELKTRTDYDNFEKDELKYEEDLWNSVDKATTNQAAKNQLQDWWMAQRDGNYEMTINAAWAAQANKILATSSSHDTELMESAFNGAKPESIILARRGYFGPALGANIIDEATFEQNQQNFLSQLTTTYHNGKVNRLKQGAIAAAMEYKDSSGNPLPAWDKAYEYIDVFMKDPAVRGDLTPDDLESARQNVKAAKDTWDFRFKQNNVQVEAQAAEILRNCEMDPKYDIGKAEADYFELMKKFQGDDRGANDHYWTEQFRLMKKSKVEGKQESDPATRIAILDMISRVDYADDVTRQIYKNMIGNAGGMDGYEADSFGFTKGSLNYDDYKIFSGILRDGENVIDKSVYSAFAQFFQPGADATEKDKQDAFNQFLVQVQKYQNQKTVRDPSTGKPKELNPEEIEKAISGAQLWAGRYYEKKDSERAKMYLEEFYNNTKYVFPAVNAAKKTAFEWFTLDDVAFDDYINSLSPTDPDRSLAEQDKAKYQALVTAAFMQQFNDANATVDTTKTAPVFTQKNGRKWRIEQDEKTKDVYWQYQNPNTDTWVKAANVKGTISVPAMNAPEPASKALSSKAEPTAEDWWIWLVQTGRQTVEQAQAAGQTGRASAYQNKAAQGAWITDFETEWSKGWRPSVGGGK